MRKIILIIMCMFLISLVSAYTTNEDGCNIINSALDEKGLTIVNYECDGILEEMTFVSEDFFNEHNKSYEEKDYKDYIQNGINNDLPINIAEKKATIVNLERQTELNDLATITMIEISGDVEEKGFWTWVFTVIRNIFTKVNEQEVRIKYLEDNCVLK